MAEAVIAKLLHDTIGYFGVTWSLPQVTECASMWANEYYWMSMAEIKHFLTKCKKGEYSKEDYRHLSPFQLMGWLTKYTDELLVERGRYGQERERERIKAAEQERTERKDLIDIDFSHIKSLLGNPPELSPEEQEKADEEFRRKRDEQVKAFAEQMGITEPLNTTTNDTNTATDTIRLQPNPQCGSVGT